MCHSLLQDLASVEERLRAAVRILLFLDFDGTLVPFVQDPSEARLDEGARQTLAQISRNARTVTTIISGRSASDICGRIGLDGVVYAGNHGLEICGRRLQFVEPVAAARQEKLAHLSTQLAAQLRDVEGAIVEFKGLTASVHYRWVAASEVARIQSAVEAAVALAPASFRLISSKMAFDIIPRTGWDKGKAVCWIKQHLGNGKALSIYLGDDLTDEDAFRVLPDGITVKVGSITATSARYCLADPAAVHEFLNWLTRHVLA
ncbi:MAG: trehalose-phosphatase [Acidobacteriia bacterium]|nr:trehalose-phosphatase [Terriglobia bacterium]